MISKLAAAFCISTLLSATAYRVGDDFARECDSNDPLKDMRQEFLIPVGESGKELIYFCGHSLGLQHKDTAPFIQTELDAWATLGVEGHFKENTPWYPYHVFVRDSLAKVAGALPHEVVAMNSLTVNLHLMMVSFYQPTERRYKVLMEAPVFSSDTYAVKSQVKFHGYDPEESVLIAAPRDGESCLRMEDVEALLDEKGHEIALVLFSGVNYLTGQFVDIERLVKKAHEMGCLIGIDLAHAIGKVPLALHDWDVDFAAWCSYKYLNSGPGAVGGVFVHERHGKNADLNRFAGWWGNDPDTRFQLHLQPEFVPVLSADSWQISNPSIFAMAPLRASLQAYDKVGMQAFREKSEKLTGYLEFLLEKIKSDRVSLITPQSRGCQLSIRVDYAPEELMEKMREGGIICDFRRPNIIRVAPNPLYNTFTEVWQFANILKNHLETE